MRSSHLHNALSSPDPDEIDRALDAYAMKNFWVGMAFTLIQGVFFLLILVWFLSRQDIFLSLYEFLRPNAPMEDVKDLLQWMHSNDDALVLFSNMQDEGFLTTRELEHYKDVRTWLQCLPLALIPAAFAWGVSLMGTSHIFDIPFHNAQLLFLKFWFFLILVFTIWGVSDWESLFSAVHYPFFGSTSWRLPADCYSLQLFPEWFWAVLAGILIFAPMLLALILLCVIPSRSAEVDYAYKDVIH